MSSDQSVPSGRGGSGPLAGLCIVEFAGIGPAPVAGMLLSDMGADVVTLVRVGDKPNMRAGRRGRRIIRVDLKDKAGHANVLELLGRTDALIEGFRPGVMERLGLGPDVVLARNPKLVYGRMTGWGQDGPLAHVAGQSLGHWVSKASSGREFLIELMSKAG